MPVFKALSITKHKQKTPLTLLDYKEPTPGANEILLQNVVAAQNPIDWKQIDFDINIPYLPWTNGGDVAGVVYKIGPKVTKFRPGDRVISFLTQKTPRHSGYQTYSLAAENRTVKLPDFMSFEDGSTFPMTFVTAAAVSMDALGIKLPNLDNTAPIQSSEKFVLVWGGSSSVGSYAVQVAKLSGYKVIATASTRNFGYVKSFGADHVFDYHDANVVSQIRAAAGNKLSLAIDAVSNQNTAESCVKSITSSSGGTVATVLPVEPSPGTSTVKVVMSGSAAADKPAVGKAVYGMLDAGLRNRYLKPNKVKVMPNGLLGVDAGFELGRQQKISGEKLVYRIAETKF